MAAFDQLSNILANLKILGTHPTFTVGTTLIFDYKTRLLQAALITQSLLELECLFHGSQLKAKAGKGHFLRMLVLKLTLKMQVNLL